MKDRPKKQTDRQKMTNRRKNREKRKIDRAEEMRQKIFNTLNQRE